MNIRKGENINIKGMDFEILDLSFDIKTNEVYIMWSCMGVEMDGNPEQFKRFVAGVLREFGKI